MRPDGTGRSSLGVLATALAGVPSVTARLSGARLVVRVRCRASHGRCRGRVALALRLRAGGTVTLGTRAYVTTASRRTATVIVRVAAVARRRARSVRVAVHPTLPAGAPVTTVSRALA